MWVALHHGGTEPVILRAGVRPCLPIAGPVPQVICCDRAVRPLLAANGLGSARHRQARPVPTPVPPSQHVGRSVSPASVGCFASLDVADIIAVVGYLALIVEAQERHSRKHQILASLGQLAHQSTAARSPETIGWPNQHSMFSSIL